MFTKKENSKKESNTKKEVKEKINKILKIKTLNDQHSTEKELYLEYFQFRSET
jgi:hypothetical protein